MGILKINWRHRNVKNKCFQKYQKNIHKKKAEKSCVNIKKVDFDKKKKVIRRKSHYKMICLKKRVNYNSKIEYIKLNSLQVFEKTSKRN